MSSYILGLLSNRSLSQFVENTKSQHHYDGRIHDFIKEKAEYREFVWSGFDWISSPQGLDYWCYISDNEA